jgi:hypothetical protein
VNVICAPSFCLYVAVQISPQRYADRKSQPFSMTFSQGTTCVGNTEALLTLLEDTEKFIKTVA